MGGLITSTFSGVEIRLDPESICRIFNIARLDSEYMSLRCGPLCWVLSLERLFKGFVDFQMSIGWELNTQLDDH